MASWSSCSCVHHAVHCTLSCHALPLPLPQMRDTYGKLIYLLMDACDPEIQELLEFK